MIEMITPNPSGFTPMSVYSFPYRLEKSPKKKGDCPECGHKNKFRYYEDQNGNRIQNAGKCERINECNYHAKPNQEQIKGIMSAGFDRKPEPTVETIFPDKNMLSVIQNYEKDHSSNFHKFCISLDIPLNHVQKWGVGTNKGNTVFIIRNVDNKMVNTKTFRYLLNGKRDKEINSFSLKQPENKNTKYGMVLFGEHLLDTEKNKIVCVVESEKSAVICSYFFPHFDFVACGAANGLTAEKLPTLFGRKIYWLADADKAGRENSSIKNLKAYQQNFEVIDLFPDRKDGFDLADAIIEKVELSSPWDKRKHH
jgi:hypothetical protein